jgi:hypothetical protein
MDSVTSESEKSNESFEEDEENEEIEDVKDEEDKTVHRLDDEFKNQKWKELEEAFPTEKIVKEKDYKELSEIEIKDTASLEKYKNKIDSLNLDFNKSHLRNLITILSITTNYEGNQVYFNNPNTSHYYEFDTKENKSSIFVVTFDFIFY